MVHCVAHKLELTVLDAAKSLPYLQSFEATMKSIYNFYHYSPKCRRELAELADVLSTIVANYSSVKVVRWVASKSHILLAVKKNFAAMVMQTADAGGRESQEASTRGKASTTHKEITTVRFVKMLHFMIDFLDVITETSKIFQREKLAISEDQDVIHETKMKLTSLKQQMGKHSKEFYENRRLLNHLAVKKSNSVMQPHNCTKKMVLSRNCRKRNHVS